MAALNAKAGAEIEPLRTQAKNESNAVLTPAQREKVKKIEAAVAAQRQQMMSGASGGAMAPKQ